MRTAQHRTACARANRGAPFIRANPQISVVYPTQTIGVAGLFVPVRCLQNAMDNERKRLCAFASIGLMIAPGKAGRDVKLPSLRLSDNPWRIRTGKLAGIAGKVIPFPAGALYVGECHRMEHKGHSLPREGRSPLRGLPAEAVSHGNATAWLSDGGVMNQAVSASVPRRRSWSGRPLPPLFCPSPPPCGADTVAGFAWAGGYGTNAAGERRPFLPLSAGTLSVFQKTGR